MRRMGKLALLIFVAILIVVSGGLSCASPTKAEVRIGYLVGALGDLPLYVAQEKGFFKDNGINVKDPVPFNGGTPMMDALAANQIDIGYVGISPAVIASARKVNLSIIAGVVEEADALIVDKSINSVSDLKGKKIATPAPGSVQYVMLGVLLAKNNMTFRDLQVLPGSINPPDMAGSLTTGSINGYIAWEPYLAQSVISGAGRVLVESKDVFPGGLLGGVIVTSKDYAKNDNQTVSGLIKAHKRAIEFIRQNPEESKAIAAKYTKIDPKIIEAAWPHNNCDSSINTNGIKTFAEQMILLGENGTFQPIISRTEIPDMEAFLNRTIDSGFLK